MLGTLTIVCILLVLFFVAVYIIAATTNRGVSEVMEGVALIALFVALVGSLTLNILAAWTRVFQPH